jgi:Zn-dependent peptidase ImmA (M78 family)
METQYGWHNPYAAFRGWRTVVEQQGILVFQTRGGQWGVVPEEMRGVSLYEDILPVILLTGRDAPNARIFTMMHELTHLALHTSGICDWAEHDDIEVFCNRVAGSVLVPVAMLQKRIADLRIADIEADELPIEELSREFSVSREVIVRRLLTLGYVTPSYYQKKREEFRQEYVNRTKTDANLEKEVKIPGHIRILSTNGLRYIETVLHAYYEGVISITDVSRYLDMRLRHLPNLERAIVASQ